MSLILYLQQFPESDNKKWTGNGKQTKSWIINNAMYNTKLHLSLVLFTVASPQEIIQTEGFPILADKVFAQHSNVAGQDTRMTYI